MDRLIPVRVVIRIRILHGIFHGILHHLFHSGTHPHFVVLALGVIVLVGLGVAAILLMRQRTSHTA